MGATEVFDSLFVPALFGRFAEAVAEAAEIEEQLADLIEAARGHLGEFETADGCIFGMAAKVATWNHN